MCYFTSTIPFYLAVLITFRFGKQYPERHTPELYLVDKVFPLDLKVYVRAHVFQSEKLKQKKKANQGRFLETALSFVLDFVM